MAGHAQLRRGRLIDGINVTPLVDIMLVLLVVFIVTAKIVLQQAVPLDLPQATSTVATPLVFSVAVDPSGAIRVADEAVTFAELRARATEAHRGDADVRAVVQADADVRHGRVIEVIDALRQVGITKIAFATRPEARPAQSP